jgi:glycosyltransferase involved in cell wall biosynthesis
VATKVGGVPEMIDDNINGLLVQPKNSQALAEKIIYLIENPEIGQKLAKRARQKVIKKFSLEKMIRETKSVYCHCEDPALSEL